MMLSPLRLDIDPLTASPLPVSLDLVKLQAAFESDDLDALLPTHVLSAIETAENIMHRTIYARAHRWVLRDFPRTPDQAIHLPRGKTQSVASIAYVAGGVTTTLTGPSAGSPAGTDYIEDLRGDEGAVLMPNPGESWPSVDLDQPAPVTITFTAGWDADAVPKGIVHGILFLAVDGIDIRGSSDAANMGFDAQRRAALFSSWALSRWY